jgi:hypothetical protein
MKWSLLRIFLISLLPVFLSCSYVNDWLGSDGTVSETEVVQGLKEALSVGIDSASSNLSVINGYLLNQAVKILLPQDVQDGIAWAQQINAAIGPYLSLLSLAGIIPVNISGLATADDSLMVALNRAAERSAPLSVNIFKDAIFGLTIAQGMDILYGDSVAATTYLKGSTYTPLTNLFEPVVDSMLSVVNANQIWQFIAATYNNTISFYSLAAAILPSGVLAPPPYDSLNTNLSLYTTQEALDGLFLMVGKEETAIRIDPLARVTDILKRVFKLLDK